MRRTHAAVPARHLRTEERRTPAAAGERTATGRRRRRLAGAFAAVLATALLAAPALGQVGRAAIELVEIVPETPGAPGPLQTYSAGETFAVWFTYNRTLPAVVPGVTAKIELGGTVEGAPPVPTSTVTTAACRSEGRTLVCPYTVTSRDRDPDGMVVPANGIDEAAGSVLPASAYEDTVEGVGEILASHKVDGVSVGLLDANNRPGLTLIVTSSPGDARRAYRAGEVVRATMRFSEVVADFGDFAPHLLPGVPMTPVGRTDRERYFIHVVRPGDNAARLSVEALSRMHDIVDIHGNRGIHEEGEPLNEAAPGIDVVYEMVTQGPHAIDTAPPAVTDIRLATARTLFGGTGAIDVIVAFDEEVMVTGSPRLRLDVGDVAKRIPLAPGSVGDRGFRDELTFRWEIESGLEGRLGVPVDALVLVGDEGAATPSIVDVGGNPAGNTPGGFEALGARIDSRRPRIAEVAMPTNQVVRGGTMLEFRVTFDEDVEVDPDADEADRPLLEFTLEGDSDPKRAHFLRLAGRTMVFGYTVRVDDLCVLGPNRRCTTEYRMSIEVGPTAMLVLAAAKDAAGNSADATYHAPPTVNIPVADDVDDEKRPRLLSVATDRQLYGLDSDIRIVLSFSEDVDPGFTQTFSLTIGERRVKATLLRTDSSTGCIGPILCYVHEDVRTGGEVRWTANALSGNDITDLARNPWDGEVLVGGGARVDAVSPTVTGVVIKSRPKVRQPGGPASSLYYGRGDRIVVAVSTSEPVVVGDDAALTLKVGADTTSMMDERVAIYRSGSGTARLEFDYRVKETDIDIDGIGVSALTGTVTDAAGNRVDGLGERGELLAAAIENDGAHPVDGRLRFTPGQDAGDADGAGDSDDAEEGDPAEDEKEGEDEEEERGEDTPEGGARLVLASEGGGDDGSYLEGETVRLRVDFPGDGVDIDAPLTLELAIGDRVRTVVCAGLGTGRRSVDCTYRVRRGDEDRNGVVVQVVSGTIRAGGADIVPDVAALEPPALRVDARAPAVLELAWSTDPGPDETYAAGDEIGVEVRFSEPVRADGTRAPTLPLRIGRTQRRAPLVFPLAGEASSVLEFRYTVVAGDEDRDGVAVPALGAGSLAGALRDGAGHEAELAHLGLPGDPAHVVDTKPPAVTRIQLDRAAPGRTVFGAGETVAVAVWFDEPVAVGPGGVTLALTVGGGTRQAAYVTGSGTERLTFQYDVAAGDNGELGVGADALGIGVTDIGGNPAGGNVAVALSATVDTRAPGVADVPRLLSAPEGGVYGIGDEIVIGLPFSERVLVSAGAVGPRLRIGIGGLVRHAVYESGSGTEELRFAHEVISGDEGDRVSVAADALELGDGAIRDTNGIHASVRHAAMPAVAGHRVDGVAPEIGAVAIVSNPSNAEGYLPGEDIVVEVAFGEPVLAVGDTAFAIEFADGPRVAACTPVDGGDTFECIYTVELGDFDGNGVAIGADALTGSVADAAGNRAELAIDPLPDDPRHRVLAAPPDLTAGIPPVVLVAGGASATVDLGERFGGYRPSFEARSSDEDVVAASVAGETLTLRSGIEGTATVTVVASNAAGSRETGFDVEVVTDPAEKRVLGDALAAVGRGVLAGTSSVIGARFDLARSDSGLYLGGRNVTPAAFAGRWPDAGVLDGPLAGGQAEAAAFAREPGGSARFRPGLAGTGFNLTAAGAGGMSVSLWGGADAHGFSEDPDGGFDGTGTTGVVGVDVRGDTLLAGLALSVTASKADYEYEGGTAGAGALETSLTGFHPYAHLRVSDDTEVWVIAGFGDGEVRARRTHVASEEETPLTLAMALAGVRRALALDFGGADYSIRGDAGFLSLGTEDGGRAVDGLSASVSRLRLGLESAWRFGAVAPFAKVSARFDGGDGTGGGGVEVAAGLRLGGPDSAFGVEAQGRVLAVPFGDASGRGTGVSVAAAFEPGRGGRGFWLRLAPRWGGSAAATDPFRRTAPAAWREVDGGHDGWGMDGSVGYGLELGRLGGVLTPFAQARSGDRAVRSQRGGLRYRAVGARFSSMEATVERRDVGHGLSEYRAVVTVQARL